MGLEFRDIDDTVTAEGELRKPDLLDDFCPNIIDLNRGFPV